MSGGSNNFIRPSRYWQTGPDYGAYASSSSDWNRTPATFPRFGSISFRADPDANRGAHNPWQSFEERVTTGPFALSGFPVQSHHVMQVPVIENVMAREANPRQRQIIQAPSPRFMNQQNMQVHNQEDDSKLTQDEQKTALKKLKKEIYNPTPRKMIRGLSLYYRDHARNISKEKEKENEAMSCAICLEDFEPKEMVMLTPCNHMYHEECIVPWVKSNGQCPVCRFSLCERKSSSVSNNNNIVNVAAPNDLFARELISVIRAMEEAFIWDSAAH